MCSADVSAVIETLLEVADSDAPVSVAPSHVTPTSRWVALAPQTWVNVSGDVAEVAPDADGPTASKATATAAPYGVVRVTRPQSGRNWTR